MGNGRAKTVILGPSDEQTQSETERFGERRRMCETFRRSAENTKFTVSLEVPVPRIVAIRDIILVYTVEIVYATKAQRDICCVLS